MPHRLVLVPALLVALALAACGDQAIAPTAPARLDRIELGMTEAQVRALAGVPADVTRARCYPDTPAYFVYAGEFPNQMTSYVLFLGGRVAQVVADGRALVAEPNERLASACQGSAPPAS